ncbi:substrate-binding domain-containing protein [Paracoccus sp. MKU1]|uniref:substrate-binding domain-containing protein n=1 Tax=Paracoccus sp. MKU1 TaxID=1745182 RepID=UPI0007192FA3|nr:substrate-binding domain-containing protein [Paracoccus sp. MKU1]KRW96892.1 rhizopine-binding protein [Paracoccus sp. MKU1]
MKRILVAASVAALTTTAAQAETIGVSMQSFDNNFQTLLREGLQKRAAELEGVALQIEDAQTDVAKQLNQVNNFIASGVDAIIVTLADTSAAPGITAAADQAGIPLVYLNLEPANIASLPPSEAYVGSREAESGKLGAEAACELLKGRGKEADAQAYILMGDLAHEAARERSASVREALVAGACKGVTIADEQPAAWQRTNAMDLTTNWITSGRPIDAIFANNDEMAIGAIQALKAAGTPMEDVVVAGIDATQDGLAAMQAGELDVTVFQNAAGQAASALDAALALARGETVEQRVMVPFELVTPQNMASFAGRN